MFSHFLENFRLSVKSFCFLRFSCLVISIHRSFFFFCISFVLFDNSITGERAAKISEMASTLPRIRRTEVDTNSVPKKMKRNQKISGVGYVQACIPIARQHFHESFTTIAIRINHLSLV